MGNDCIKIINKTIILIALIFSLVIVNASNVYAVNTVPSEDRLQEAEERKLMMVETNELNGWPMGPMIGAQGAILMDADTGIVLYAKNIHEHLYPASTTKLMTALIALENSTMDEVVTFSYDAIHNVEAGSSRIGIDVGEQLTMEQCLYGLLLGSANEVAYAIAEHIGGTYEHFVEMMNERAQELGCYDTHFVNPNGLPDDDHYTSAYDLCVIAQECFKNESLMTISGSTRYTIPPTNIQSQERPMDNHHLMLPGFKYEYEGILAGKTGYTSVARQTLVTCAKRNGMRLICVIMKEESPSQFTDTKELLDYGFSSFEKMNIAENESRYTLNSATFFNTNKDIIGSSKPILSINKLGEIILPKTAEFTDADVAISYSEGDMESIARLTYTFDGHFIGQTTIDYAKNDAKFFEFSNIITEGTEIIPEKIEPEKEIIFVSTKNLILILVAVLINLTVIFFIAKLIRNYIYSSRRSERKKRRRYKKRSDNLYL